MLVGATRFNDLARGLPGISRSLLAKRLRKLERAGVVVHEGEEYRLTAAGRDLQPIVFGLGEWGARHAFGDPRDEELDPEVLLWWARGGVDTSVLPGGRTVIAFQLHEPSFRAWLLVEDADVELRKVDPGYDVDVTVRCSARTLARVWLGRTTLRAAMRGDLELSGRTSLVRALPEALKLSPMAALVAASST